MSVKTTARYIAMRDISRYAKENDLLIQTRCGDEVDVWYATSGYIDSKENRRLNRELGLSSINHFGNKNGVKKKV